MVSCRLRFATRTASIAALVLTSICMAGCQVAAPIHVWEPPALQSAVGKRVVLQGVFGPPETADLIKEKLLTTVPTDTGRTFTLVEPQMLANQSKVRLASATDQPMSDVMLASDAKRQGIDFLLRGEVITERKPTNRVARAKDDPNQPSAATPGTPPDLPPPADHPLPDKDNNPRLVLSWRLTEIGKTSKAIGQPLVIDYQSAILRYPDLAGLSDRNDVLTTAAVRETYGLVAPSVDQQLAELAKPYATLGASEVRRGNAIALAGRWSEAARIWQRALDRHPMQAAAVHNLALAAVAGQDFSRAKELARQAVRMRPIPLHKRTLAWVELRQRGYHESFNLADPPEGWFVTHQ